MAGPSPGPTCLAGGKVRRILRAAIRGGCHMSCGARASGAGPDRPPRRSDSNANANARSEIPVRARCPCAKSPTMHVSTRGSEPAHVGTPRSREGRRLPKWGSGGGQVAQALARHGNCGTTSDALRLDLVNAASAEQRRFLGVALVGQCSSYSREDRSGPEAAGTGSRACRCRARACAHVWLGCSDCGPVSPRPCRSC